MAVNFLYPEYEVCRNSERCIACRVCERQCANGVHEFLTDTGKMVSNDAKCVNCHRCVALCPTRALKIVKSGNSYKDNANWTAKAMNEIYRQASSGGVLLSSMGNPENYPVFFDKILINASQVTNPPIDPLREPMETKVFLGAKPKTIQRDASGRIINNLDRIYAFDARDTSAMSYGSLSYNAHEPGQGGGGTGYTRYHR